jgi:hypothetical protein
VDALVELAPQPYDSAVFIHKPPDQIDPNFQGQIADYRLLMAQSINRKREDCLYFHGVMPGWDNTASCQLSCPAHVLSFEGTSPDLFEYWLRRQSVKTLNEGRNKEKFVFINAWNAWAEGAHLEPCVKYAQSYLQAVKRAVQVDRYLSPTLAADTAMAALSGINVFARDDVKYFTALEYAYHEALNEIVALKALEDQRASAWIAKQLNTWPDGRSLRASTSARVIAALNWLRTEQPATYALLRRAYRACKRMRQRYASPRE